MSTVEMEINFAKPKTDAYSWQPSTVQTPYQTQNHPDRSDLSFCQRYRRLSNSLLV